MYKTVHAFHKFLCVYNMSSASVQPKEVISCCFQDFKNKTLPWSLSQNIIRYSNRGKKSQQRSHISYRLKLLPGRTVLHEIALTCLLLTSLIQKIFHPSIRLRKMNSCGDHLFKMNQNISKIIFDINYALSVLIWYVATCFESQMMCCEDSTHSHSCCILANLLYYFDVFENSIVWFWWAPVTLQVFGCCNPAASRFELHNERCSSVYFGCSLWPWGCSFIPLMNSGSGVPKRVASYCIL